MAATSNHIGDIAIWIEKVINSCDTSMQEMVARHLIQNFEKILIERDDNSYSFYTTKLRDLLDMKLYDRIEARAKAPREEKPIIDRENDII